MIEVRLLLLLDRIFQVADIIGRRYTDVKDGAKGLALMIDEETPNDTSSSHRHGGDSSQTQVTQPPKFPKQVKGVKAISTSHMYVSEIDTQVLTSFIIEQSKIWYIHKWHSTRHSPNFILMRGSIGKYL